MKTLYLVRHAKSSWDDTKLDDFDRPLNRRGLRDAPFMGKLLAERGEIPEVILTSSASRAVATARHIAGAMGLPEGKLHARKEMYLAGPEGLVDVILELDDAVASAMLVGHNPGMTQLASRLCVLPADHLPTCAVAAIQFDAGEWRKAVLKKGELKFFETPKQHLRK